MAEPIISIDAVSKSFGSFTAVSGLTLAIHRGEFFSLLGASGCGKTTLLRMLAGLEQPSDGRILIDGTDMTGVPPYLRPVNMMFQSYALFPHMTVEQNVAFGLKQENWPKARIRDKVAEMLDLVQMAPFARRRPAQLSGGQRQRVALARSLAKEPKVLLLDEPLAALDKKLREQTRLELVKIQHRVGITFVMVTHDQEEAMTMSSRIAVMKAGAIEQVGTPVDVYEYPTSIFVADFIGTANMFEGVVSRHQPSQVAVACPELERELAVANAPPLPVGAPVKVMVRPEKLVLSRGEPQAQFNWVRGKVADTAYLGGLSTYHIELASGRNLQATQANLKHVDGGGPSPGDELFVAWHPANAVILVQ